MALNSLSIEREPCFYQIIYKVFKSSRLDKKLIYNFLFVYRMVHQPSGGARGQATDIQIQAEEIIKLKKQLNEIYVKHTKQPLEYIYENMERDKVRTSNYFRNKNSDFRSKNLDLEN